MKVAAADAAAPPPTDRAMASEAMAADGAAMPPSAPAPASMPAGSPPVAGMPGNATPPNAGAGVAIAPSREMLDIEAHVTVQVPRVKNAVRSLHELSARVGGVITAERVDTANRYGSAELTLRVPSGAAQDVLEDLEKLGSVLDQNVTARDIGKEYFDANLRLSSLEATLHRYEEILKQASKVEEVLRIEAELSRIRAEIEQVKGNLRWLSDRAARATLHLTLREKVPEIVEAPVDPEAKFFPGLRLPALVDFGKHSTESYAGGGFSLRFSRAISLDLDVLKHPGSTERGPDAVLASLGGEIYSDLLGGGERRFLNPYLGWRAGYARFGSDNQALVGATLGLELYKNRWFGLDLEGRNYLAFGGSRGGHYLLEPALAARIAF
ncbi:MAG TPA: DUF4349 domain-containing protein [Polyangiaceae bacterium]|nr:DUF4349 domain-containing protein [Polyangiaceae bacterium]